jgi:hypothetical protein
MKIRKILKQKENDKNISNINIDNDSIINNNAISGSSNKNSSDTNSNNIFETEEESFKVFENDSQIEVIGEIKEDAKKSESNVINISKNTIEQSRFVIGIYSSLLNSVCAIISGKEDYIALKDEDREELSKLFLQAYPEWQVSPKTTFWVALATTTGTNIYLAYKSRKYERSNN